MIVKSMLTEWDHVFFFNTQNTRAADLRHVEKHEIAQLVDHSGQDESNDRQC